MEGIFSILMDTLGCTNYDSALSIITMLTGDHEILCKLKEHLEGEQNLTSYLQEDMTKLEDTKIRLLKHNSNLKPKIKE